MSNTVAKHVQSCTLTFTYSVHKVLLQNMERGKVNKTNYIVPSYQVVSTKTLCLLTCEITSFISESIKHIINCC